MPSPSPTSLRYNPLARPLPTINRNSAYPPLPVAADIAGATPHTQREAQVSPKNITGGPLPALSTRAAQPASTLHPTAASQASRATYSHTTNLTSALPSPSLTNEPSPASISPHGEIPTQPNGQAPGREVTSGQHSGGSGSGSGSGSANPANSRRPSVAVRPSQPRQMQGPSYIEVPSITPEIAMQHACNILDERVAQFNGYKALKGTIENPRYRILRDACQDGDLFYVLLHRYFCVWSRNRSAMYSLTSLMPQTVDAAFDSLLGVLRNNDEMSQSHLVWFSEFPEFLPRIEGLNTIALQVFDFLAAFAFSWPSRMSLTISRMYPLLASETRYVLKCLSPQLEGILFTVSRRGLGVGEGPLASQLEGLFAKDRFKERLLLEQGASARAYNQSREDIVIRFRTVVLQARRQAYEQALPRLTPKNAVPPTSTNNLNIQSSPHETSAHAEAPDQLPNLHDLPPNGQPDTGHAMSGNQRQHQMAVPPQQPLQRHASWSHPIQASPPASAGLPSPSLVQNRHWNAAMFNAPHNHNMQTMQSPTTPVLQYQPNAPSHERPPPTPVSSQYIQNPQPVRLRSNLQPRVAGSIPPAAPLARRVGSSTIQFTTHALNPNEYAIGPHDWTSVSSSLHLANIRSPKRIPSSGSETTRHYQFFNRFAVEPKAILPHMGLSLLEFSVSEQDLCNANITLSSSEVPTSQYFDGSLRYRLRLCKRDKKETQETIDEATWSVCRSHWPQHIFILFNDKAKLLRRKQHFHYDLPVELTDSVVVGKNVVKVNLPDYPSNVNPHTVYFIAVEVIRTLNHDSTRTLVEAAQHISSDETRREIQRRMNVTETDDILIENDTLTVAVTDPFSSRLFEVPVRGRDCKHLECIDLQNWLITRPSKPSQGSVEPTMVDFWACPICGLDARPPNLQVDDYFVEIRRKILETCSGVVRKILISANGNWSPIEGPDEDEDETPAPEKDQTDRSKGPESRTPTVPETIIILDD